jgi:hypothetical protein
MNCAVIRISVVDFKESRAVRYELWRQKGSGERQIQHTFVHPCLAHGYLEYLDSALDADAIYRYAVRAMDAHGEVVATSPMLVLDAASRLARSELYANLEVAACNPPKFSPIPKR